MTLNGIDELVERNQRYAIERGDRVAADARPACRVAIVTCMDARIDIVRVLALKEGDAHIIRNAGGTVTEDVIRSLAISQVTLGTREIMLIKHTDCGLSRYDETEIRTLVGEATGTSPPFTMGTFREPDASVRESVRQLGQSQFIPYKASIRGFVCDLSTGTLREVRCSP